MVLVNIRAAATGALALLVSAASAQTWSSCNPTQGGKKAERNETLRKQREPS